MPIIFDKLLIPFLCAMFLALTMGGSGTSPAFAAAYGANLIKKNYIPAVFGFMVFLGAIIAGKSVVKTLGSGIIGADKMTLVVTSIVLISVALSLLIANLLGVPQSTSQCTVLSLCGAAYYFNDLQVETLLYDILPTWFITPVIAFIIMMIIGLFIFKPLNNLNIIRFNDMVSHPIFKVVVIVTSCYVAFAIGANNVANASGPIASMIMNELNISSSDGSSVTANKFFPVYSRC
jgi:sulfate permease